MNHNHDCSMGPVSSMPGSVTAARKGTVCDDCGAPAQHRVQGETDSFGCEYLHFCNPCMEAFEAKQEEQEEAEEHFCSWCSAYGPTASRRDVLGEGSYGPVYELCRGCERKLDAANEAEFEADARWEREKAERKLVEEGFGYYSCGVFFPYEDDQE